MPLDRYRAKRNFGRTPEPAPGPEPGGTAGSASSTGQPRRTDAPGGCGRFVVHRHRAGRLHYDLRLEIDGVLASWALPKGPTRDPDERRFAARTEDHPIEYLDFEGVIPKGEYGAGDSICWDWGTFEPELTWDPGEAVRAGELKLRLRGEKLAGRFTLVRTGDSSRGGRMSAASTTRVPPGSSSPRPARRQFPAGILRLFPRRSRRVERTRRWPPASRRAPTARRRPPCPRSIPLARGPDAQPPFLEPMLATPGSAPFDGDDWLFEPKWDGYRVQAIIAAGKVELRTRNRHDAGRYFPELLGPPTWLAAPEAIVDGEVVALDDEGRPDFGLLQARLGGGFSSSDLPASPDAKAAGKRAPLVFMAFDLPWCAGRSYVDVPLEERKEILRLVLREHSRVRYAGHVARDGVAFYAAAAAQGLEGAMAKHRLSRYEAGRRSIGVAQAQGPAHPGAGRGRIRPGPREPPRPRRARRRGDGEGPAPVRRARGQRPRRRNPVAPPGSARRAVAP